jgi:hypothetical protein
VKVKAASLDHLAQATRIVPLDLNLAASEPAGTKALRVARERREILRTSDFRVVYRMSRV